METIRICKICGKEFKPNSNDQKYCSSECYNVAKKEKDRRKNKTHLNETKICAICRKEFMPNSGNQKYCEDCKTKKVMKWSRKRSGTHLDEPRKCLRCGKEFLPKSGDQKYCSECGEIVTRERNKEYKRAHPEINSQWSKENRIKCRAASKRWREKHAEEIRKYNREIYRKNPAQYREKLNEWAQEHPDRKKMCRIKDTAKRKRNLGFIELNHYQKGYVAHHIDRNYIIWIPEEIHKSISHSVLKDKNMDEINALAFNYLGN